MNSSFVNETQAVKGSLAACAAASDQVAHGIGMSDSRNAFRCCRCHPHVVYNAAAIRYRFSRVVRRRIRHLEVKQTQWTNA
jgi:hypothetical protein